MSEQAEVDVRQWIGRQQTIGDYIDAFRVTGMSATMDRDDPEPRAGDALPPGWHWLFFAEIARQSRLGPDGHAARGEFLPPIALPRRMWGGALVTFHQPLRIDEQAERQSTVRDITLKDGRSGRFAIVALEHLYSGQNGLAIEESHDVIYRAPAVPGAAEALPEPAPMEARWQREVAPDPVLLFRYSALTFNGHRIHYDHPYVTGVEGYRGLIVHGPLTATLLLELVRNSMPEATLASARVRARRPLFADRPFEISAAPTDAGCLAWATDPDGGIAMTVDTTFA